MKLKDWGLFEKRFGIPPTEAKFSTEQTTFFIWIYMRKNNPEITEEQVIDMEITQDDIKRATEDFFGVKAVTT
jgi:hypothetical protein